MADEAISGWILAAGLALGNLYKFGKLGKAKYDAYRASLDRIAELNDGGEVGGARAAVAELELEALEEGIELTAL